MTADQASPFVIVHGSDIADYKKCRTLWNFHSNLKPNLNLELVPTGVNAFWFGSGIHEALAAHAVGENPLSTWTAYCQATATYDGKGNLVSGFVVDEDTVLLGLAMLTYYCQSWAPRNYGMRFLHVERAQIVPLFQLTEPLGIWPVGTRVFYGYKLDGLTQDSHDRRYILEYKTAAKFESNYDYLLLDEQSGRYWWAEQKRTGLQIEGVDYIILKKKAIQHLKVLKNGGFSVAKDQDTNYETAAADIKASGQDPTQYQEYLDYLREKPENFVMRHTVRRNPDELYYIKESLHGDVLEMLDDPRINRNPSSWNCGNCQFFEPCLQRWEGSDYKTTLRLRYKVREEPYQRVMQDFRAANAGT